MKYVVSCYNQDISWLGDYTDNVVLYDRSETPIKGAIVVSNVGSDLYDKFSFIIEHYDNLPEVAVYTKANIFKYITRDEFDLIKDNKTFTPILTQGHRIYNDERGVVNFYRDGIYWERNDLWYLGSHPVKDVPNRVNDLMFLLGIWNMRYVPFAPGSNYILPKENILKHPKDFYVKLRGYLDWAVYPGEAQIIERGLYTIWR